MYRRGTHIYYVSHIVNHSCDTSAYSTNTRTSRTARCTLFYEASFCPSVLSSSRSTQSTLSPRALAARSALLCSTTCRRSARRLFCHPQG
ncbi:hypothetical protein EJ02DRAFT_450287 [Clathrospora elynae]|uniref:Uncharacterized protein n=1 Tax=Clathrospora elynae TaxID=706981 RepID=A0A6A5T470_9PLEO|nr:hypothetical protein EJ02DRAFT_450287 [Clathrospora elynae]